METHYHRAQTSAWTGQGERVAIGKPLLCLGAKSKAVSSWKFSPPNLTLGMHFSSYYKHLASAHKYSSSHSFSIWSSWPLLDFSWPLLDLSLIYLPTFSLSPSVSFPSPIFPPLQSPCPVSQQLLGSDGLSPQCKTLTCSLVTDYPNALLCCSLNAYRDMGANTTHTRLRSFCVSIRNTRML